MFPVFVFYKKQKQNIFGICVLKYSTAIFYLMWNVKDLLVPVKTDQTIQIHKENITKEEYTKL